MKRRNDSGFSVGSKVLVDLGAREEIATIVEDLGNIGWRGRRMWRVRLDWDKEYDPNVEMEMPEVELKRVAT